MSTGGGGVRAWIELARLSNAPTIASNAITGTAIGLASASEPPRWGPVLSTTAGMVLLYVAGMFLNDAADAAIDRRERPTRPIPSGRIARGAAWGAGAAFLAGGVALCAPAGGAALVLAAILAVSILVYDLVHKVTPASVVLLSLCRALVYVTVAASVCWPIDWSIAAPLAGGLGLYVTLLSVVARVEAAPRPAGRPWLVSALAMAALMPIVFFWPPPRPVLVACAGVFVVASLIATIPDLTARPPRIGHAVGIWLAGICMVDGYYLFVLDRPAFALGSVICLCLTRIGHRYVTGT